MTATLVCDYYTIDEGSRVAVIVALSRSPGRLVTIPPRVTLGTAEPGDVGPATAVDIWGGIPGRCSAIGHIAALHDADTDDETFTVSFGDLPEGVIAGSPDACSVTIKDHWPVTLAAVSNITAVTDDDSVDLFWTPVSGASGYELWVRLRDQGWDRGWLGTGWVGANWRRDETKIRAFVDTPRGPLVLPGARDEWYWKGAGIERSGELVRQLCRDPARARWCDLRRPQRPDNHVRISWNTVQGADAYWYQHKSAYVDYWGEYGWHHIQGGQTNNVVIDLWSGNTSDFQVRANQHRRGRSHYSPPSDPYRFTVP